MPPFELIEPTSHDLHLVDKAIQRACRSTRVPDPHRNLLRKSLIHEVRYGRRDEVSLLRAARKALDQI